MSPPTRYVVVCSIHRDDRSVTDTLLAFLLQLFFHKFFSQKLKSENARKNKAAKRKGGNDDDDALSDGTVEGDDDDEVLPRNTAGGEVAEDAEEGDSSDDEEEKAIWKVSLEVLRPMVSRTLILAPWPHYRLCSSRCRSSRAETTA